MAANNSENYNLLKAQKPKISNQFNAFLLSIKALTIMRIIEVNGRFNLGLFFSALRPLLLVFIVGVFIRGYDPTFTAQQAFQSVLFCGAVFFFWREIAIGFGYLDSRKNILYLPNTSHIALVLSCFLSALFIFIPIFFLCFLIFFFLEINVDVFRIFEAILYASILGFCFILPISFFCFNNNIIQQFVAYVPLIALFTSCVFYPLKSIPLETQSIFLLNPLVHIVEIVRSAVFPEEDFSYVDVKYILIFSFCLLLLSPFGYISNIKR